MAEHSGGVGSSMNSSPTIRWKKGELIGCGAHARVYKGQNLDSGELIAVKEVLIASSSGSREQAQAYIREVEKEVNFLHNLSHRNIVQYLGTAREEHALYILLEFMPGGSLFSLLGEFGSFTEPVIQKYTKQLLQGLEYLHKNDIIHRDIKGANILVEKEGCIKLADFGASKKLLELEKVTGAKSLKGTIFWMAPEVIRQTGHHVSADIWSVGCTVIEMATGKPPWCQQFEEVEATLYHIATTKSHPPIPDHLSSEAKDFLQKCLKIEPNLRPTASELLQHPFIVGDHIYDVFLSFRGLDVRNTLANELFQSLQNEGLHVFLDSERIEKGENIGMSLEEAIKDSRFLIPIFSPGYASSAWCLRELSLMWRCKARRAKTKIIPLFYDVEPCHVRYPESERSAYAEAFNRHRLAGRQEIEEWKAALEGVSLLSGWVMAEGTNPSQTIPVIVKEITAFLAIKRQQQSATQHPFVVGDHKEPHLLGENDDNNEKDHDLEYYSDNREKNDELERNSESYSENYSDNREEDDEVKHNSESSSENYSDNREEDDELEHNSESSSDSSHFVGYSTRWSPIKISESYAASLPLHEEVYQYPSSPELPLVLQCPPSPRELMAYAFQAEQSTPERVSETWNSEIRKPKKTWGSTSSRTVETICNKTPFQEGKEPQSEYTLQKSLKRPPKTMPPT